MINPLSWADLDHLIAFQNKGIDSTIRRGKMVMTYLCPPPKKVLFLHNKMAF